jgi:hypothetical protein
MFLQATITQMLGDSLAQSQVVAPLVESEVDKMNLLDLAVKGGWIMIVLLLLSFVCIYIFVNRILVFKKAENKDPNFMARISDYVKNGEPIALYEGIFVDDALVFHGFKSNKIGLLNPSTGRGVEMDLTGFPYVGIWAVDKPGCPYACIEPWFGRCDAEDFNGDITEREWSNALNIGEKWYKEYEIIIHE